MKCPHCQGRLFQEPGGLLDPTPELVCISCGNVAYSEKTLAASRSAALMLEVQPGKQRPSREPTSNGIAL